MFSLTIVFGPGPMVWTLLYTSADKAAADRELLFTYGGDVVSLTDQFGQKCDVRTNSVHGAMLEDLEQSKLAHIERALHQARVKAKADEMAMADPVIKASMMKHQSPIYQPAMPGMPNGQWS